MQTPQRSFDIVVIGAGPAGSLAALHAARAGLSVLLLDKSKFPRPKVCGCCLSSAALDELRAAGLSNLPAEKNATPLTCLDWRAAHHRAVIPLPRSVALSRSVLDDALAQHAAQSGAQFLPQTHAALRSPGVVELRHAGELELVTAKIVLLATGLAGESGAVVRPGSRMGAGVTLQTAPDEYAAGTIHMACAAGGYVGLVRLEDNTLDLAAALDPTFVRAAGGPGAAAAQILEEAGMPAIESLSHQNWRGTPLLTRHAPAVAGPRLFRIGDAAGYVEPFTGEGMAWAMATGRAAAQLAVEAARASAWRRSFETRWAQTHRELLAPRMARCGAVARLLRHPRATALAIRALSLFPGLASPVLRPLTSPL